MFVKITRRRVAAGFAVLALILAAGLFAGGWHFSSVLEQDGLLVDHSEDDPKLTVIDYNTGFDGPVITIGFAPEDDGSRKDLERYAAWGLKGEDSFGLLGAVVSADGNTVTRAIDVVHGGFRPGDRVRLSRDPFLPFLPGAPTHVTEAEATLRLQGMLGEFPAWLLKSPSGGDRWVVMVHGRTAGRDEPLRAWLSFDEAGYNSLIVTYRNDEDAPPDPSGYYQFGLTEWEDIEPAVRYALDQGAEELVLAGFSMGGGVVLRFMEQSELAGEVDALVLDAPMLDFGETVELGARERSVPGTVTVIAKWLAGMRFGVDWTGLNYLSRIEEVSVPVLLFHGDDDHTVPVETSRKMAETLPGLVTYEEFPGAGHVAAWNSDPGRYRAALLEFLSAR